MSAYSDHIYTSGKFSFVPSKNTTKIIIELKKTKTRRNNSTLVQLKMETTAASQ